MSEAQHSLQGIHVIYGLALPGELLGLLVCCAELNAHSSSSSSSIFFPPQTRFLAANKTWALTSLHPSFLFSPLCIRHDSYCYLKPWWVGKKKPQGYVSSCYSGNGIILLSGKTSSSSLPRWQCHAVSRAWCGCSVAPLVLWWQLEAGAGCSKNTKLLPSLPSVC